MALKKIIDIAYTKSKKITKDGLKSLKVGTNSLLKTSDELVKKTKKVSSKAYNEVLETTKNISNKTSEIYDKITEITSISDDLLEKKLSNKFIIFCLLGFSWLLFHSFYSFTQYISEISYRNLFGLISAILGVFVMGWLAWITICDIAGIITIYKQNDFRRNTNKLIKEKDIDGLKQYLLTYPKLTEAEKEKLQKDWINNTILNDILTIFTNNVLKKTDKEIHKVIKQYATYSASLNVVAKKPWFDFIITLYFYSKIIIEIAHIYKIKIGICSFFKLMMFGFLGSSVSTFIQKLATESTKNLPIINILTEAAVNGTLVYVLGSQVQSVIRPVKEKI